MRKRTPTEEAAELLEYVLAVGSMSYLRPRDLDMSFYELYMLDVISVLIIGLVVIVWMANILARMCLGLTAKEKLE